MRSLSTRTTAKCSSERWSYSQASSSFSSASRCSKFVQSAVPIKSRVARARSRPSSSIWPSWRTRTTFTRACASASRGSRKCSKALPILTTSEPTRPLQASSRRAGARARLTCAASSSRRKKRWSDASMVAWLLLKILSGKPKTALLRVSQELEGPWLPAKRHTRPSKSSNKAVALELWHLRGNE